MLDKNPAASPEQEVPQLGVLPELGQVPGDHSVKALLDPELLIEPAHLPAQRLGRSRMRSRPDALGRLGVAEQLLFWLPS